MTKVNGINSFEVNFDGLVGPTHNYAGLSYGNLASGQFSGQVSHPREAALQGLNKMKALSDMGVPQAVLPPHERPNMQFLKRLGFDCGERTILQKVWDCSPELLANHMSSSAMWVANAATISPFADTADAKTHFTAANLSALYHRALEPEFTSKVLQTIFSNPTFFHHHQPLPANAVFGDEGAANHTRFCDDFGQAGVELFVYGMQAFNKKATKPVIYPARQTLEACQAIVRLHGIDESNVVFAQQNPVAIDAGVFHNDVIAVGHKNVLFYHEKAFVDSQAVISEIAAKMAPVEMHFIEVPDNEVSLRDAVQSYLFNTQLVVDKFDSSRMYLIAPVECRDNFHVAQYLQTLCDIEDVIQGVHYFDLQQSMQNGGGPACLRLRVVLSTAQLLSLDARVMMNDDLFADLKAWINQYYREALSVDDLRDHNLISETRLALDELTNILQLGAIYPFQS